MTHKNNYEPNTEHTLQKHTKIKTTTKQKFNRRMHACDNDKSI